jgi:hypothetical protein
MLIFGCAAAQAQKIRKVLKNRIGVRNSFIEINRLGGGGSGVLTRAWLALLVTREPPVYYACLGGVCSAGSW